MNTRQSGFTMIEMMMVIALLAVLMMVAAPSVRDLTLNARMTSTANDLMTDLSIARSEAVKQGARTAVCSSSTGTACTDTPWEQGWIVFIDADADGNLAAATDIVKVVPALQGITAASVGHATNAVSARVVPFRPSGTTNPTAADITFTLCDARTVAAVGAGAAQRRGRQVSVTRTGRSIVTRFTCP